MVQRHLFRLPRRGEKKDISPRTIAAARLLYHYGCAVMVQRHLFRLPRSGEKKDISPRTIAAARLLYHDGCAVMVQRHLFGAPERARSALRGYLAVDSLSIRLNVVIYVCTCLFGWRSTVMSSSAAWTPMSRTSMLTVVSGGVVCCEKG